MTKTKQKETKPETLTARFEVLDKGESFEGRKLYSLRFSDIGYYYFIRVYADQLKKLRATQPKPLPSMYTNAYYINRQKEVYQKGMAQGKKLAFAEVRRWNTKNINAPITWLLLESWLDEKKEAQKGGTK